MARRRVTVALTGDGGDEAFLGYPRYAAMRRLAQLDRAPEWGRRGLERLLARVPAARGQSLRLARIREALRSDPEVPEARYGALVAFFADSDKRAGYGEALQAELGHSALALLAPYFAEAGTLLGGANWADFHTYLPDDLLVKVDVASMAHGLEARAPLLDHELLEWVCAIPHEVRMAGGSAKALFKRAMAPFLPRAVLRRRKMGFSVPVAEWLRGALKELAYDTLLSEAARARGLFAPPYVRRLLDEHCSGASDHHRRLWALLMLELWFAMWIDAPAASAVLRPAA
jgi:asparagine synthase (glutamine-hydrolysing)